MNLFEHRRTQMMEQLAPLSTRMRPRNFSDFVGQQHLVGENCAMRRVVESDRLPSMILWGPPGSGKTTMAGLIANITKSFFETVSAVTSGVKEIRSLANDARVRLGEESRRTVLFIDEIHRFSKSQQDALLPYVEDGTLTLIGATTENPSFEVIGPLLSRSRVFVLNPLSNVDLSTLIDRALSNDSKGLAGLNVVLDNDARMMFLNVANGDARIALDSLEFAVEATAPDTSGLRRLNGESLGEILQRQAKYDKDGDAHYDTISAFIKSVRSSDPDAALYWLARMLDAGEDPLFISRRLVILAAEDIGLADPDSLNLSISCQQGVHLIGMPEARILLAETTLYLASAPKSNRSFAALGKATDDVRRTRAEPVPIHLRNASTGLMEKMGYGKGYKYAHDFPESFTKTNNMPENLSGRRYYFPSRHGFEKHISERLEHWWGDLSDEAKPVIDHQANQD